MLGVYCASAEPSAMVAAGFVAARGWAHETAASRGLTLATLEQLAAAGDLAGLTVARVQVAVGALSTTLLVQGSRDDVALVLRQVQQRLSGERPLPERVPAKVPDGRPIDSLALWWRFGAQSFGLLDYPQNGLRDATDAQIAATLAQISDAGLVPFGVDSDAATVLEPWCRGVAATLPDSEPLPSLPAHLAMPGAMMLSVLATSTLAVAAAVVRQGVAPLVAAPAPGRSAWIHAVRDLGPLGTHEVLCLPDRAPTSDEVAQIVATLARLRREGPTETEIVLALDHVAGDPVPAGDPLRAVLGAAEHQAVNGTLPKEPTVHSAGVHGEVIDVLDSMLVLAPPDDAWSAVLTGRPGQFDTTRTGGRRFRPTIVMPGRPGSIPKHLRIGPDGLCEVHARTRRTIRAADVVAVEHYADGDRRVLSRRGYHVHVDPLGWRRGSQAIELLDSQAWAAPIQFDRRSAEVAATKPDEQARERIRLLPLLLVIPLFFLAAALRAALNPELSTSERLGYGLLMAALACAFGAAVLAAIRQYRRLSRRLEPRMAQSP